MRVLCMIRFAFIGLLVMQMQGLHAQQSEVAATGRTPIAYRSAEPVSDISASGALLAFVLLAGAACGAWYLTQKRGMKLQLRGFRNDRMRLLETLHLSSRTRIYMVEVDGGVYLVGENASGLTITAAADKTISGNLNRDSSEV